MQSRSTGQTERTQRAIEMAREDKCAEKVKRKRVKYSGDMVSERECACVKGVISE